MRVEYRYFALSWTSAFYYELLLPSLAQRRVDRRIQCLRDRQSRLIIRLSIYRLLLSIIISACAFASSALQFSLVNWRPWSGFNIIVLACLFIASLSASTQKSMSLMSDSRRAVEEALTAILDAVSNCFGSGEQRLMSVPYNHNSLRNGFWNCQFHTSKSEPTRHGYS